MSPPCTAATSSGKRTHAIADHLSTAKTPEDHEAIAGLYREEAERTRDQAENHQKMIEIYR